MTYKDNTFSAVEGAVISLDRKYIDEDVYKSVENIKTDYLGQGRGHFDLDNVIYRITVTKDNVLLSIFENVAVFCTDSVTGDCRLNLYETTSDTNPLDFDNYQNIGYTLIFNQTLRKVILTYSTLDGSTATILLNVSKSDIMGIQQFVQILCLPFRLYNLQCSDNLRKYFTACSGLN